MKAVYTQYHLIEYLTQEMRIEIRDESSIHSKTFHGFTEIYHNVYHNRPRTG